MKRADDDHVEEVIDCVRLHLQQRDGVQLRKTASPDREERNEKACDALLEGHGRRYAVEHTTLDSYEGQRGDTARFDAAFGPLDERFRDQLPYDLEIAVPVHSLIGRNWGEIRAAVERYIVGASASVLPYDHPEYVAVDGVPVKLLVCRRQSARGTLFLARLRAGIGYIATA